jgi:hypothetical protein
VREEESDEDKESEQGNRREEPTGRAQAIDSLRNASGNQFADVLQKAEESYASAGQGCPEGGRVGIEISPHRSCRAIGPRVVLRSKAPAKLMSLSRADKRLEGGQILQR